jgi:hypothetical protein
MARQVAVTVILLLMLLPSSGACQEIAGLSVRLVNGDIYASFSLELDAGRLQELREGIDKELKLYVDLFRVWKSWPDEFVLGKAFTRRLRIDNIKKEYVATSFDGSVIIERRFRSPESLLGWVLSVRDLKLAGTRDLQPGQYFVRVTAESKVRKLPPVIGYLFIFVKETDFKISQDSPHFTVEAGR